jgi:hypothetical protein
MAIAVLYREAPSGQEALRKREWLLSLSERRALTVVRMSAAALRYVPLPDADPSLRDSIVALHAVTAVTAPA